MSDPVKSPRTLRAGRSGLTIRDVARAAEVSIGTASKALNGTGQLRAGNARQGAGGGAGSSATGPTTWRRACTAPAR